LIINVCESFALSENYISLIIMDISNLSTSRIFYIYIIGNVTERIVKEYSWSCTRWNTTI